MKKIILTAVAALGLVASSCDDQLDIVPKGKTTLDNLADLELLLNQEYVCGNSPLADIGMVCNDGFPAFSSIPNLLASANSLNYAYASFNENVDRAVLTESDTRYNDMYKYIYYSNVVIDKADDATGDDQTRTRIVAEAKLKRAYFHYILVNIYARQYDEATATETGGVPYVDYLNMEVNKDKNTVAEVYAGILRDCDEGVIACVPDYDQDVCRADKAFGYAVRAKTFMQMKRYDEAADCAAKALRYNNNLEDRSTVAQTMSWDLTKDSRNNYLYVLGGVPVNLTYTCMSKELAQLFSEDDFIRKYELDWGGGPTWGDAEVEYGYPGGLIYTSFGGLFNNCGIRTEDMYYILAETNIRGGNVDTGLDYMDKVRTRRIDGYTPLKGTGLSKAEAMKEMQAAKRIEFYGSYNNFFDRKRWNSEAEYRENITRDLGDYGTFTITPDSPLWVMPFPSSATRYNPTLTQNY